MDMGGLCEGSPLSSKGHPRGIQPLGNAAHQPVLQRHPAATSAAGRGTTEDEGGLRQAEGAHQQQEEQEQKESASGVIDIHRWSCAFRNKCSVFTGQLLSKVSSFPHEKLPTKAGDSLSSAFSVNLNEHASSCMIQTSTRHVMVLMVQRNI